MAEKQNEQDKIIFEVPFFQSPNSIFDCENYLTEHEIVVYLYLCRCGNHGAHAFPSYNTIAKKCKISRRTAIRAIAGLKEKVLLIKQERKINETKNQSNIYIVQMPSQKDKTEKNNQEDSNVDAKGGVSEENHNGGPELPEGSGPELPEGSASGSPEGSASESPEGSASESPGSARESPTTRTPEKDAIFSKNNNNINEDATGEKSVDDENKKFDTSGVVAIFKYHNLDIKKAKVALEYLSTLNYETVDLVARTLSKKKQVTNPIGIVNSDPEGITKAILNNTFYSESKKKVNGIDKKPSSEYEIFVSPEALAELREKERQTC